MRWRSGIILALLSLIFAVFLVEVGLRTLGRYKPPENPLRTRRPELYQADDKVGYRLWRSKETSYRYPADREDMIPLVSNSDGFRNSREFDEPDARMRVLVIGDSFVFGDGVREEERLTEVLESIEPAWRVDNLGMTGWGLDLMLRGMEHVGVKAHPDVVVLAVYTDDFRRVTPYYAGVGFGHPKFELQGSELVTVPYPYPNCWERLRIVQALFQTYWQRRRNRYDLNEALLDRFLQNARRHEFRLVTVFIPGKGNTSEDRDRRAFLRNWSVRHDVPHLDLTEAIHSAGIPQVYIKNNWHWNPTGHRIAAEELHHFLASEVLSR